MMFGPKSRLSGSKQPPSPANSLRSSRSGGSSSVSCGSGKTKSGLLQPPTTAASTATRTAARSAAAASSPLTKRKALSPSSETITLKQSATTLAANSLANGRSSSKSSVISDTSASICSSSSHLKQPQQRARAASTSSSSSIRQPIVSGLKGTSAKTTVSQETVARPKSTSIVSVGSGGLSSSSRRVPTLAMSLRDKDQQIKLLIKERDEQKYQAQMMARKAEEWEEKFLQSEVERSHVTSEADDEVIELRRLAQELEDENKRLAGKLAERDQLAGDTQFKLDELDIERQELRRQLDEKQALVEALEREQQELVGSPQQGQDRSVSEAKYEREIEELNGKLQGKEEQMMQLRSSLEMRKNELTNLQSRAADLERKLKIETERSDRHLKRIDEINLELKAAEAKLSTKCEENEMYEKQVKQLRQELRSAEDKLEQISLARKKDVDILHNKLSAARRGSTTPTSPVPYKTPTPQDEIVRLQMEIRDLKDQLIDREAELDCNRRDMDVLRKKMETRTLEVDCNNQELARRCQDLLEQNRQSEDTVKQLLKSTTEHSAQLMRATDDLKEANLKCVRLREEINELELKLEEQMKKCSSLVKENSQLKDDNEDQGEQIDMLRQQVDNLNEQLRDLCQQLDHQTNCLHKDREALANQLAQQEIDATKMTHDLATAKQDLRTSKLQTQEVVSERDRLKQDLVMKEQYIASRNDIIETMRHELEDCKKSLAEYKQRIEEMREAAPAEALEAAERLAKEMGVQLESLKSELQLKLDESLSLRSRCDQLSAELEANRTAAEKEQLEKLEAERKRHDEQVAKLMDTIEHLQAKSNELEQARQSAEVYSDGLDGSDNNRKTRQQYEEEIEFLNTVVSDMRRKCDSYKSRLSQLETINIMNNLDSLISGPPTQAPTKGVSSAGMPTPPPPPPLPSQWSPVDSDKNKGVSGPVTASALHAAKPLPPAAAGPQTKNQSISFGGVSVCGSRSSTLRRNGELDNHDDTSDRLLGGSVMMGRSGMLANNGGDSCGNANVDTRHDIKPSRISGRPYCDICNVFDLHHTIYCPRVSEKLAAATHHLATKEANNLTLDSIDSNGRANKQTKSSTNVNGPSNNINNNNNSNNNNSNNGSGNHSNPRTQNGNSNINNNNNNNDNNYSKGDVTVDELFREYEQSLEEASTGIRHYASLRRQTTATNNAAKTQTLSFAKSPATRPHCVRCNLYGHTARDCNSSSVRAW